jgi:hypothetical protein
VNREGKMRSDILFLYKHETELELVSLVDITTFRHLVHARNWSAHQNLLLKSIQNFPFPEHDLLF